MNSLTIIAVIILSFFCFGTYKVQANNDHPDRVFFPKKLNLTLGEIAHLEEKAKSGDCDASYRLYQYYAFCTSNQELALENLKLAVEQGRSDANSELSSILNAVGENIKPETPTAPSESTPDTTPINKEE